ncbi:MAG: nitrilase-related carbon-nitrogen hydrolase, partial [Caldilineaceae bacterium]
MFHPRPIDHRSWFWLVGGALLLPFMAWQTVIPLAAWLAPVLLMRFARTQRVAIGLALVVLVSCVAQMYAWRNNFFGGPANVMTYSLNVVIGVLFSLGYVSDRLLAPRLSPLLRTLAFPVTVVVVEYLLTLVSPIAAGGALAYSQPGNLPLLQLAALTGMWGPTFLIAWCAPAVNGWWEQGFTLHHPRSSVLPFALTLGLALLLGGVRLAFSPQNNEVVRVAALSAQESFFAPMETGSHQLEPGTAAERGAAGTLYERNLDDLIARTRQAAAAGAKIVGWPENAVFVLKEDEAAVIDRLRQLAAEEGIYLVTGFRPLLANVQWPFAENRVLIIDPSGVVVSDYAKTHTGPGDAFGPGPGRVPTVQTPYGRLAAIICVDADFPATARQVGQARTDILVLPVDDWAQITTYHTDLLALRAIENGVTVVRPAVQGIGRIYDAYGRVLAQADYFADDRYLLLADIPMQGTPTLYARIGDSL